MNTLHFSAPVCGNVRPLWQEPVNKVPNRHSMTHSPRAAGGARCKPSVGPSITLGLQRVAGRVLDLYRLFLDGPHATRRVAAAAVIVACALSGAVQAAERRIEFENGDVYVGEVVDGERTGRGIYTWANGSRYEGEFLANRRHGSGVFTWPDGRRYEGEFAGGTRHGRGLFIWLDGRRYEGHFEHGKRSGQGTLLWPNGDRYDGAFANNRMHGQGVLALHDTGRYEGPFVDGKMHGEGVFTWPDGRRYEGQFIDGNKAGLGTLSWPNGNRYRGQFEDDERTGLGTLFWRDGTVFHGQFAAGLMEGFGVKQMPDGSRALQQWERGELVAAQSLAEETRCRLRILDRRWMFDGDACINGLAHGRGLAVSLDGDYIVTDGHFVLGRLVGGSPEPLKLADS